MRILFITPYLPSMIRVRPFNFLKRLSQRHEITLVSLVYGNRSEAEELNEVEKLCKKVYPLPVSKIGALISCCRKLFTPMPLQAAYTYLPAGNEFIRDLVRKGAYDVVHVEHIRGAHLAEGIKELPVIYDSVDCITRLLKQKLAAKMHPIQRILDYEELYKMRLYEAEVASGFNNVVITSRQDKRVLEWLINRIGASSEVTVVRNGVDSDYFHPNGVVPDPLCIAFSGKMSYYPNVNAVLKFYNAVFPWVRRSHPRVKLKVIGSNPPESILRLARDSAVQVTGYVPDIRHHLASAGVIICPLDIGVGMQNKVLEAMAMGRPVVASSVACKGIPDAADGVHLIRENDSRQMSEVITYLLNNPEVGHSLGTNAARFVRENYGWEAAVNNLEDVYHAAIDIGSRTMANAA